LFEEAENLTNIRRELIIEFLQKYHPSSVTELRSRLANEGIRAKDDDLLNIIRELQRDGDIRLSIPVSLDSFAGFLIDTRNLWWIYATVLISLAEVFLVRYNVQDPFLGSVRLMFGLGLLGFLPGYATVQVLFPKDQLSLLEQILVSIFLSVVVSIGLGVILGAGYFFNPTSGVILSSIYAIVVSILAGHRRYSALRGLRRRRFQSA
jgi:uncharacterized protein DUF1616